MNNPLTMEAVERKRRGRTANSPAEGEGGNPLTLRAVQAKRQREADSYTGPASGSARQRSGQSTSLPRLAGGAAPWYKKDGLLGAALDRAGSGTVSDGTQGPVKLTDPVRNALAAEQTRAQARVKELEEDPFAHKLWAADRESLLSARYGSVQGYKDRIAGEQDRADAAGAAIKRVDAQHRQEHWAGLKDRPDFAEKSRYKSTRYGEAKMNWAGSYTDTGYGDILYDYVNGDENARRIQDNLDVGSSGSLYATTHSHYRDLPEDTVQTFNYLYAARGKEAAYNYLDEAAAREYTGVEALGYGFAQGSGVTSAAALLGSGYGLLTGDEEAGARTRDWYGGFLEESAQAGQQHPYAYGAGNVSGNLALMAGLNAGLSAAEGALSTGVKIGGRTFALRMTPAVQTVVNSSAAFLAADAAHNAGAAATGCMNAADFLKSAGTAGVQGFAGGLAGGLVSSGMAQALKESGLMTPFMEFVRQSASGFASAGANTAAGYLLREDKPSREQAAVDFATAFLFSVLQGAVSAYSTTQADKARMEEAYGRIAEEYGRLSRGWGQMTPEARAEAAAQIRQRTQDFRAGLNRSYMAGQQDTVDAMNRALDGIDAAMGQYAGGFGSPAAGSLPPGSADLTAQAAQAVEQGLALARGNGSFGGGAAPAGPDPGLMGAAAAQGVGTAVLTGRDFAETLQRRDELALRRWE